MRPSHRVSVGVVLACALVLVARHMARSRPLASPPAPPFASLPDGARSIGPAPSIPAAETLSSPDAGVDRGILLARRCLALAERDPLAAMEMALADRLQEVDSGLLANLVNQWAAHDFDGAHGWIKTQESGVWRNDMLARLAYLRAQTDLRAAARLAVSDITPGPVRDEAMICVLHQWALRDPGAAKAWADSFPDYELKNRAWAEIQGLQDRGMPRLRN